MSFSPKKAASSPDLEEKVQSLEALVRRQAAKLDSIHAALSDVKRDIRSMVTVVQYNILASYLGHNTQPWFLYGAEVTKEQRSEIMCKYLERDASGKPKNSWPAYVQGVLTPAEIQAVIDRDADFQWNSRKARLVGTIRDLDPDVISLVELDEQEYFRKSLSDQWDMVFHKRPRAASLDGCGVFWRRSKFSLVSHHAIDFIDGSDDKGRTKRDRSCLMVLLRWNYTSSPPLVVVSTHLAKDPENRAQTAVRVRQVSQLMEALTEFTRKHDAAESPVVLCGDLNAKHFGEIRGIARTVWQMTGSQLHKFLWCASDVPTGPTSITKARQCRIDAVQFLAGRMEVVEVRPMPKLEPGETIPSADHPSDHFPVYVKFRMKDDYQTIREVARAWLECVAGREKVHPLTMSDLRCGFDFFDRNQSGTIRRYDLEEACSDLNCGYLSDIQTILLDCFPESKITYDLFIKAYEVRLNHERMRSIGELEAAFEYFADGKGTIPLHSLEEAFREITPISFSDEEVKEMIRQMDLPKGTKEVDLRSFCKVVCRASFPHRDRRRFSTTLSGISEEPIVRREVSKRTKTLQHNLTQLEERSRSVAWGAGNSVAWTPAPQLAEDADANVTEYFSDEPPKQMSIDDVLHTLSSPVFLRQATET